MLQLKIKSLVFSFMFAIIAVFYVNSYAHAKEGFYIGAEIGATMSKSKIQANNNLSINFTTEANENINVGEFLYRRFYDEILLAVEDLGVPLDLDSLLDYNYDAMKVAFNTLIAAVTAVGGENKDRLIFILEHSKKQLQQAYDNKDHNGLTYTPNVKSKSVAYTSFSPKLSVGYDFNYWGVEASYNYINSSVNYNYQFPLSYNYNYNIDGESGLNHDDNFIDETIYGSSKLKTHNNIINLSVYGKLPLQIVPLELIVGLNLGTNIKSEEAKNNVNGVTDTKSSTNAYFVYGLKTELAYHFNPKLTFSLAYNLTFNPNSAEHTFKDVSYLSMQDHERYGDLNGTINAKGSTGIQKLDYLDHTVGVKVKYYL